MKFNFTKKAIFFTFLYAEIFLTQNFLFAESFRVRRLAILTVPEINQLEQFSENNSIPKVTNSAIPNSVLQTINENLSTEVKVGINDSLCIKLPKDLTFVQGIELDIKIPNLIAQVPNTIIYSLYDNVSPIPTEKTIDYTGTELFTGVYPGAVSLKVQIPIIKGNSIKKSPYAEKTLIPNTSRGFIFFRNQLAMKGIPNDVLKENFSISAKPILLNKGRLFVKFNNEKESFDKSVLTITIDDKIVELDNENAILLKPGTHTINISGESIRNENRSCIIEIAKDTTIEFDFQDTEPLVFITMPQGTQVFANGEPVILQNNSFNLIPGEHTLKFLLGGYEIVKTITIQKGRSYSIDVTFDASIKEN